MGCLWVVGMLGIEVGRLLCHGRDGSYFHNDDVVGLGLAQRSWRVTLAYLPLQTSGKLEWGELKFGAG